MQWDYNGSYYAVGTYFFSYGSVPPAGHYSFPYTLANPGTTHISGLAFNCNTPSGAHWYSIDNLKLTGPGLPQTVASYTADITSHTDYYPFGQSMPGRTWVGGDHYRYDFNGKESDKEVTTGAQDFGSRMYDNRIGRWASVDPMRAKGPSFSPYNFCFNSPIAYMEEDGEWPIYTHWKMTYNALRKAGIDVKTAKQIAYFASTHADHPSYLVLAGNMAISQLFAIVDPNELAYKYQYKELDKENENSQSFDDPDKLALHATRGVGVENKEIFVTREDAVNRAFKGAMEVFKEFKGKDLSSLSDADKARLGRAFHTIEDMGAHNGARWSDNKAMNEHSMKNDVFGDTYYSTVLTNNLAKLFFSNSTGLNQTSVGPKTGPGEGSQNRLPNEKPKERKAWITIRSNGVRKFGIPHVF